MRTITFNSTGLKLSEGKYLLTNTYVNTMHVEYSTIGTTSLFSDYYVSPPLTGTLEIIKIDKVKRIIAGTFNFDAVNDKGDRVEIRDGRFDLKY